MDSQLLAVKSMIWYLKLFIILKISVDSSTAQSSAVDLTCLQTVCGVDCEGSKIETLPADNLCSAIASYSNDTEVTAEVITKLRGELPYVFVVNNYCHEEIIANVKPEKLEEFLNTICALIKDNNINVLVIDHTYKDVDDGQTEEGSTFQADFTAFLQKVKEREPAVLIGVALSKNTNILNSCGYNVTELNGLVDLYLVKSHSYRECKFYENQPEAPKTSPIEEMQETLKLLTTLQYDLAKTILTIDVRVASKPGDSIVDESYSTFCRTKQEDPNTEFCQETLENFYKKGALVFEFHLAGLLLRSFDRDDHDNSCACGAYPATTVIAKAAKGEPEPTDLICCKSFGVFSNATQ